MTRLQEHRARVMRNAELFDLDPDRVIQERIERYSAMTPEEHVLEAEVLMADCAIEAASVHSQLAIAKALIGQM